MHSQNLFDGSMNEDFIVPLNGLAQGRTAFRRSVGKEFFERFGNSDILDAGLDVAYEVEKSGRFIGVDCEISGKVTVACDRCLRDLELPVSTGFNLSVKFGDEPADGEIAEEGGREIVYLPENEADYDLSQVIYDYACLSLPTQRVHGDGACDPEVLRYLSSENDKELTDNEASKPFASLKALLESKTE